MTREEAIKGLKVLRKDFSGYKPNEEMFDMAIKALEQLSLPKIIIRQGEQVDAIPSADRLTGHWIDDDEQQILMKKFIEKGENWKVCNICGAGMRVGAKYDTDEQYRDFFHNYCPNCGARMESGEE